MNDIDWSKAPEGATHYSPENDSFNSCWVMKNQDILYQFVTTLEFLNNPKSPWLAASFDDNELIPRPESKPIYTQAVKCKQNNKMYITGCLYEFKDEADSSWELGRLVDIDGKNFRSDTGVKREWYADIREVSIDCGTITESPIELIDFKPYLFKLNGQKIGFYRESRKSFFTDMYGGNKICGETEPKDIQLLEVKS